MSLYNLLNGHNPHTNILKIILDLDQIHTDAPDWPKNPDGKEWDPYNDGHTTEGDQFIKECQDKKIWTTGRFRDIYINEDGSEIILYTRNGGGNREAYFYIFDILSKHPNYLRDWDDDFDSTYAYIAFSIPDDFKMLISGMITGEKIMTISEKFNKTMEEIGKMSKEQFESDPRFQQIAEIFKEISG